MPYTITKIWTGAANQQWTTPTNWTPSNAPTAGDSILIPAGTPSIDCAGMTTNVSYGVLIVGQGYNGTIGASGTRLTGHFTSGIEHKGNGKMWLNTTTNFVPRVWVCGGHNGDLLDADGYVTQYEVIRGTVNIAGTAAAIDTLVVGFVSNANSDASVTVNASTNVTANVWHQGGFVKIGTPVTRLDVDGGICVRYGTNACTTIVASEGTLYYEGTGTITALYAHNNVTVDFNRTYADARGRQAAVTITSLYRYPGCRTYIDPSLITVSNDYDRREVSS